MDPKQLRYAPTHEWAHLADGVCTVGISQFAVEQLTDVTHVELPKVGRQVRAKDSMGEIESVKAVSDIYAPVDGEVAANNQAALEADPGIITADPYGQGWLVRLSVAPGTTLDHLLTYDQYQQQLASEGQ
jgi:glycine cleavage system H protein